MVESGLARSLVNRRVNRVKHVFKWAAGEEMVSGAVYQAPAGTDIALDDASDSDSINAHSILIKEGIGNVSQPGSDFVPGDTANVQLTICVSDFFSFDNIQVTSVLADGLTYVDLSASETPSSVTGDDPTTLLFDIGALVGNAAGGTRFPFDLLATVDEFYVGSGAVLGGDVIPTSHTLDADVSGSLVPISTTEPESGDNGSVPIIEPTFEKSVFAIDGAPPAENPPMVRPGQVVTFRLTTTIASGDQGSLTLTDFLPLPVFHAEEHGLSPAPSPTGAIRFGPAHTAPASAVVTSTVSDSNANNSITFEWSNFQTNPSTAITFDMLLDFTVVPEPYEDGLVLTNLLQAVTTNTAGTIERMAVAALIGLAPNIEIRHGATAVDSTHAQFDPDPPAPAAPYTTEVLDASPIRSDVADVDAGDLIEFTITVQNRGRHPAHNIVIGDTLPLGLEVPGGGLSLSVTQGDLSTAVAFTGDLLTGGIALSDPIPAYDSADTSQVDNVVVVRYTLAVSDTVRAQQALAENVAAVSNFTSVATGGINFVEPIEAYSDGVGVDMRDFDLTATLLAPTGPSEATIQDTISYQLDVVIPEGTHNNVVIVDELPSELAALAVPVAGALPAGVSITGSLVGVPDPSGGQTITWTLGTVTNLSASNATDEVITFTYDTAVLNNSSANRNDNVRNDVTLSFDGGVDVGDRADTVTLEEPRIELAMAVTPTAPDASDTVTFTATIDHRGDSQDAHDLIYTMTLPTGLQSLSYLGPVAGTVAPTSGGPSGDTLTLGWDNLAEGEVAQFEFTAQLSPGSVIGSTVTTNGTVTWTGQPGVTPSQSPFTDDDVERDGSGGINDYSDSDDAAINVPGVDLGHALVDPSSTMYAVGASFTYDVAMGVPEGESAAFTVVQT
ncbi:MAG: hypothetical protein AAGC55_09945, partial [Myxococcota bacterium]